MTTAAFTTELRYLLIQNIRRQASLISEVLDTDFRDVDDDSLVDVDMLLTDLNDALARARGEDTDI